MTTTTTEGRVSRAQREIEVAGLVRAGGSGFTLGTRGTIHEYDVPVADLRIVRR